MISLESEKFPNDLSYGHVQPLSYHNTFNSFSTLCQCLSQFFFPFLLFVLSLLQFHWFIWHPSNYLHSFLSLSLSLFLNLSDASSVEINWILIVSRSFQFWIFLFVPPLWHCLSIPFSIFFQITWLFIYTGPSIRKTASLSFMFAFVNFFLASLDELRQSRSSSHTSSFRSFLLHFSSTFANFSPIYSLPRFHSRRCFINLFITWFVGRGQAGSDKETSVHARSLANANAYRVAYRELIAPRSSHRASESRE